MNVDVRRAAQDAYARLPGHSWLRFVTDRLQRVTTKAVRDTRGTAVEARWVTTHLVTYPLGLVSDRYLTWPPVQPLAALRMHADAPADDTDRVPVLLVHGMGNNRSVFSVLARRLRRTGNHRVYAVNLHPFPADAKAAAARFAEQVERICARTGHDRLHVVGHSLGGLLARYYVQRLGGDARVATLVTMGTPHRGTALAKLLPRRFTGQLLPDSDLMAELQLPAAGCRTRFVCFWSDLDQLMSPRETAALEHPDLDVHTVAVQGVGHASLPADREVVQAVCDLLRAEPPE